MDAFLLWLRLALGLMLGFTAPEAEFDVREGVRFVLETKGLFTPDMRELMEGGLEIEFTMVLSMKAWNADGSITKESMRMNKKVRFDYIRGKYCLSADGAEEEFASLDALERAARETRSGRFQLPADWRRVSLMARLKLVDNPILKERLGLRMSELWGGYVPSIIREWERGK